MEHEVGSQLEVEVDDREGLEHERAQVILEEVYAGLKPAEVWHHFAFLNAIPRPSKLEARARAYVQRVAQSAGAMWRVDGAGNIVVYKEGSEAGSGEGAEGAVAIQAHLDMVCERVPERSINWSRDPIIPVRVEGRIEAMGTTLGADNGIGAAMALALLSTPGLSHPPLELLFTVEEETGLQGASRLDGSLLSARRLLNLDTEKPDEIIIGCAGGRGVDLSLPIEREPCESKCLTFALAVGGLAGGHSGVQIAEPLGNAIQILAQSLRFLEGELKFRLVEAHGGNARNAIPRDARALVIVDAGDAERFQQLVRGLEADLRVQWHEREPSLTLKSSPAESALAPLTSGSSRVLVDLLFESPHGVLAWSQRWPGKVETSCNLATLSTGEEEARVHISGRSFREAELQAWQDSVQVLASLHNAQTSLHDGYPGWEPSEEPAGESSLREMAAQAFERVAGARPKIEIVHAGLECGIILSKCPGMEAISFGPLIRGAHTPEEYVDIASVEHSWRILVELLQQLQKA